MIKLTNASSGEIQLSSGDILPAGGSVEIPDETWATLQYDRVVQSLLSGGFLIAEPVIVEAPTKASKAK